jgi:hypothetical protein
LWPETENKTFEGSILHIELLCVRGDHCQGWSSPSLSPFLNLFISQNMAPMSYPQLLHKLCFQRFRDIFSINLYKVVFHQKSTLPAILPGVNPQN